MIHIQGTSDHIPLKFEFFLESKIHNETNGRSTPYLDRYSNENEIKHFKNHEYWKELPNLQNENLSERNDMLINWIVQGTAQILPKPTSEKNVFQTNDKRIKDCREELIRIRKKSTL
jgi:hypothetical protein